MSDIDITDADRTEARRKAKEYYREQTGRELPDHVLENLELLSGPSLADIAEVRKYSQLAQREIRGDETPHRVVLSFLIELSVGGLVGLYMSRFFVGWGAQVVGGALVALLAYTFMKFLLEVVAIPMLGVLGLLDEWEDD